MNKWSLDSKSRILVVGTSGSGKSTLARRLSQMLDIKDIELDALFWEANWTQAKLEIFKERIEKSINPPGGWVLHGNYSKVRDLTWGRAETVIWLDYSKPLVFWRVFKRSVQRILSKEELWSGNRESFRKTFLSKDSIILWSVQTYDAKKKQYEELIRSSEYSHLKVLRFQDPEEVEDFLIELRGEGPQRF